MNISPLIVNGDSLTFPKLDSRALISDGLTPAGILATKRCGVVVTGTSLNSTSHRAKKFVRMKEQI